ncbi:hypothetical protein [Citricoccus sp. I39-566]|uniref:hypothetical protein n=1 Tax=Citricoccus sp. I39-566 TaxID=3073268 RepID=UPI00286BA8F3|nr:hypothetical protein [Citricoccus sp. I39-566]WMY77073.1 hypothetical protein RE421_09325 [Citricoccus sp. I39-566]
MSVDSRARALAARVGRPVRRTLRGATRRVGRHLPEPLARRVRQALGLTVTARASQDAAPAVDPLGLAPGRRPASGRPATTTGRAAAMAMATQDPESALRLDRALLGGPTPRPEGGGRGIAALAAADLVTRLESAGHVVHALLPGTARAAVERGEVVVVDLAGMTGVWSGALDAEGVALYRELQDALGQARLLGRTAWLVDRGPDRFRLGAAALRRDRGVQTVRPGTAPPAEHITEDPGAAPTGVVDLLRGLDPLDHLDTSRIQEAAG